MPKQIDDDQNDRIDELAERLEQAASELGNFSRQLSSGGLEKAIASAFKSQEKQFQNQIAKLIETALSSALVGSGGGGNAASKTLSSSLLSLIPGFARGGILDRRTVIAQTAEAGPEVVLPLKKGADGRLGVVAATSKNTAASAPPVTINLIQQDGQNSPQLGGNPTIDDQEAIADLVLRAMDDAIDRRLEAHLHVGGLLNNQRQNRIF